LTRFDWRAGTVVGNTTVTQADVDADYGLFISNLTADTFDTARGIMLTHELNNFSVQEDNQQVSTAQGGA
jgi:hypothetical protein